MGAPMSTAALSAHCLFSSAAAVGGFVDDPVSVGVLSLESLLPHATRELAALGLEQSLASIAIETRDATFFNRFGQLIYQEPLGRAAGYEHPQFSIHRGDLQIVLLAAFRARAGSDRLNTNHHCIGVEQDEAGVSVHFSDGPGGQDRSIVRGGAAIACEIIPDAGTPVVLYVDSFGRFEGNVVRRDGAGFGVAFVCTPSKRERTAEQLILFLNKTLVDDSVLRRHERSNQKGFAKFTRADGQIVHCEVTDISVGGVSLKTEIKPPIGEFVLIAQIAGRVARHHADGIGIEFVGQEKTTGEPAHRINLVR